MTERFRLPQILLRLVLGERPDEPASPERIRTEFLVLILQGIIALVLLTIAVDIANGISRFNYLNIVALAALIVSLVAIGKDYYRLAVDSFMFGGVTSMCVGILVLLATPSPTVNNFPIGAMILFIAITIIGFLSDSRGRIFGLLAFAITFDATGFALAHPTDTAGMYYYVAIAVLHVMACGLGCFLLTYFIRISRIAEARRIMNRNLEALIAEAHRSNSKKLHSISHDIRSPITAIMGVQALLSATDLNPDQQRYLDILTRSNRLLLDIVESILDSETENVAGAYPVRRLFDTVLDPFRSLARAKGVDLQKQVQGNPPALPLTRAASIRVMSNLVDNALKYTESGSVLLSASINRGLEGRAPELTVSVSDNGRGMPPDHLEKVRAELNGPDAQIASSRGLGLPGVRRLVAEAGGKLDIQSTAGEGTTVTLIFPVKEA